MHSCSKTSNGHALALAGWRASTAERRARIKTFVRCPLRSSCVYGSTGTCGVAQRFSVINLTPKAQGPNNTVSNGLAQGCLRLAMENGRVRAPYLSAWVSEDDADERTGPSRTSKSAAPHGHPAGSRVSQRDALHPSTPRCESIWRRRSATANSTLTRRTCAECPPRGCPCIVCLVAS